jgi:hypothetical protein
VSCAAGVSIGVHGTTLYASLYRFDDIFLVNAHTFGAWACQSPVYEVHVTSAGGCSITMTAFQPAWDTAAAAPDQQPTQNHPTERARCRAAGPPRGRLSARGVDKAH